METAGLNFSSFLRKKGLKKKIINKVKIISNKWFPAAHLDFYVAHPLKIDLLVYGTLDECT